MAEGGWRGIKQALTQNDWDWPADLTPPENFEKNAEGMVRAQEWCSAETLCLGAVVV